MICAIDIGNTRTKVCLIDEKLIIVEQKNWSTPDLFEPDSWKYFFDELYELNPLFFIAELRISCVNWKVFLALKVYLKYDSLNEFDTNKEFNLDLLILPLKSPIVMESYIPLTRDFVTGLIGTDRLLVAYAAHKIFSSSIIVVSLGTATTIDLVTNTGVFFSGPIIPGVDVAYQGLTTRATTMPALSLLEEIDQIFSSNVLQSLYTGSFLSQALLIESVVKRQTEEINLRSPIDLVITGGRAFSVSKHIRLEHKILENLVVYGLALIPDWKNPEIDRSIDEKYIQNISVIHNTFSSESRMKN